MAIRIKARLLSAAVMLFLLPASVWGAAGQKPTVRKHPIKQVKQEEPPPAPAQPPPPPTLEQMPSVPPKVVFSNGLLSIAAENSTLGDILRAVRNQTRAEVEFPPNATERVVTHLGPGPVREVLASLLNGTHFNYVMLESATHPGLVDRLILTSKAGAVINAAPAPAPPPPSESAAVEDEPPEAPQQVDISEQPVESAPESSEENRPQQQQPQVKTPEQLLRELQQMQQQQQQPQQGQEQPAQNHPQ